MSGAAVLAEAAPVGVRLVARHVNELLQERGLAWRAALNLDRLDAMLVTVMLSANLARVPASPAGLDAADEERRPVSLLAVAQSMGLAYETVRRRSRELAARGAVVIGEGGCVVPAALFATPATVALAPGDATALAQTLDQLGEHRLAATVRTMPATVAARLLLDFSVRVMEPIVANYGSVVACSVFVGIVAANVRPLLAVPALSRSFANEEHPPPDALRRPVGLRVVARELNLPYETVRRQAKVLIERGLVAMTAGGALVPTHVLMAEPQLRANRAIHGYFQRLCADLSQNAPDRHAAVAANRG